MAKREFYAIIERDEDGYFIGEVPQLKSCHSYGKTLDELMGNMKEVILLCLDEKLHIDDEGPMEFVGAQRVAV